MRVVDTSAWLEWISDSALGRALGRELPETEDWIVPTIVQYELTRWLTRVLTDEASQQTIGFSMQCKVVQLDTRIAVRAAEFARAHSLALADAIIYATAIEHGADLLSCDAHFADLPGVVYFPKPAP
jgi:predicted nucleic acid-binding protein